MSRAILPIVHNFTQFLYWILWLLLQCPLRLLLRWFRGRRQQQGLQLVGVAAAVVAQQLQARVSGALEGGCGGMRVRLQGDAASEVAALLRDAAQLSAAGNACTAQRRMGRGVAWQLEI